MLTSELFERTQQDVEAHDQASTAFQRLARHVYDGGKPDFDVQIGAHEHYYAFRPETVQLGFEDVCVFIGVKRPRTSVVEGAIMKFSDSEVVDGKYRYAIVIYSMRQFNENELKATVNSTSFIPTFQHEYVHMLDIKRTDGAVTGRNIDPRTSKAAYYNDPAEFNAFYHTFGGDWLRILQDIKKDPGSAQDYKDLYGITGDFAADLKNVVRTSGQSHEFFNNLTERNRRRIIARLYQVYQAIQRGTTEHDEG